MRGRRANLRDRVLEIEVDDHLRLVGHGYDFDDVVVVERFFDHAPNLRKAGLTGVLQAAYIARRCRCSATSMHSWSCSPEVAPPSSPGPAAARNQESRTIEARGLARVRAGPCNIASSSPARPDDDATGRAVRLVGRASKACDRMARTWRSRSSKRRDDSAAW